MSALPFLVFGLLKPSIVSEDVGEDISQLISTEIAPQAILYREIQFPGIPTPANARDFLALAPAQRINGHDDSQPELSLKPNDPHLKDSPNPGLMENYKNKVRYYELIQDYYPEPHDNPPAQLITIEMEPNDESDFDKWYREEHIPLLELAPGYRRSIRYRLLSEESSTGEIKPLKYLALHEVENVDLFMQSEETRKANSTAWTKRQVSSSEMVFARAWKRLGSV